MKQIFQKDAHVRQGAYRRVLESYRQESYWVLWADANKEDEFNPKYGPRLVAKEINTHSMPAMYAGTRPIGSAESDNQLRSQ